MERSVSLNNLATSQRELQQEEQEEQHIRDASVQATQGTPSAPQIPAVQLRPMQQRPRRPHRPYRQQHVQESPILGVPAANPFAPVNTSVPVRRIASTPSLRGPADPPSRPQDSPRAPYVTDRLMPIPLFPTPMTYEPPVPPQPCTYQYDPTPPEEAAHFRSVWPELNPIPGRSPEADYPSSFFEDAMFGREEASDEERAEAARERLGYDPDWAARSLQGQATDPRYDFLMNSFDPAGAEARMRAAQQREHEAAAEKEAERVERAEREMAEALRLALDGGLGPVESMSGAE